MWSDVFNLDEIILLSFYRYYDKRGTEKEDLNLNALFITLRTDTMARIPLR